MFLPGQQVVCIDGKFSPSLSRFFPILPQENNTYIIRDIVPGISPNGGEGEIAVYLQEMTGWINDFGIECGFNGERFAPLETITDKAEEREVAFA